MPYCGYLVANRNGRDHDFPHPQQFRRKTSVCNPAVCREFNPHLMDEKGVGDGRAILSKDVCVSNSPGHPWHGLFGGIINAIKRPISQPTIKMYFTGDGALRDENGHYRITGRVDDVIIVSGTQP